MKSRINCLVALIYTTNLENFEKLSGCGKKLTTFYIVDSSFKVRIIDFGMKNSINYLITCDFIPQICNVLKNCVVTKQK